MYTLLKLFQYFVRFFYAFFVQFNNIPSFALFLLSVFFFLTIRAADLLLIAIKFTERMQKLPLNDQIPV